MSYHNFILLLATASANLLTELTAEINGPKFGSNNLTHKSGNSVPTLRPSLFPNVPPYLQFLSDTWENLTLTTLDIGLRYLKWGTTTGTKLRNENRSLSYGNNSAFVDQIPLALGLTLVDPLQYPNSWMGMINCGRKKRNAEFEIGQILRQPFQKYNMMPGSEELADKDKFHSHLQRFTRKFGELFSLTYESFSLPHEFDEFRSAAERRGPKQSWILKPNKGFMSRGVKIFKDWRYIPNTTADVIVQRYLPKENQMLINGNRVELRIFVVVTSFSPLRVFLYDKNLIKVFEKTATWRNERDNGGVDVERRDYHMDGTTLFDHLEKFENANVSAIKERINDIMIKSLIVGQSTIAAACHSTLLNSYNAYQVFTFDFLFEKYFHGDQVRPRLLEVNRYGALVYPKSPFIKIAVDALNLVGLHLPPTLSVRARNEILNTQCDNVRKLFQINNLTFVEKLYKFENHSSARLERIFKFENLSREDYLPLILKELEPSELRQLMIAEDELSRVEGTFERIFPTNSTFRYLKYLESEKYVHYVQDAWEKEFSKNRNTGISYLADIATTKKHIKTIL